MAPAAIRVVLVADELLPRATVAFGDGGVVELLRRDALERLCIAWGWNGAGDISTSHSQRHLVGENGEGGGEESRTRRRGQPPDPRTPDSREGWNPVLCGQPVVTL